MDWKLKLVILPVCEGNTRAGPNGRPFLPDPHLRCVPASGNIARRDTATSLATSTTVRPLARTSWAALYLCSAQLISLMAGSVTNQPK